MNLSRRAGHGSFTLEKRPEIKDDDPCCKYGPCERGSEHEGMKGSAIVSARGMKAIFRWKILRARADTSARFRKGLLLWF